MLVLDYNRFNRNEKVIQCASDIELTLLYTLQIKLLVLWCTAAGQLSGNEDVSVLHSFIAYLPSAVSFAEVKKFKRRPRYLEFFVQVARKGLADGNAELVIGWCTDAEQVLVK